MEVSIAEVVVQKISASSYTPLPSILLLQAWDDPDDQSTPTRNNTIIIIYSPFEKYNGGGGEHKNHHLIHLYTIPILDKMSLDDVSESAICGNGDYPYTRQ